MMKQLLATAILVGAGLAAACPGAMAEKAYDNVGITLTKQSSCQGMDIWGNYLVSLQNAGKANLYNFTGTAATLLGSFNLGSAASDNHSNLASFGTQRYAETDKLPLLYVSRAQGTTDADGMVNVCYVERIDPDSLKSTLVQKICFTGVNGAGQYMIDRKNGYLYIFGNTIKNSAEGNKHYIYKFAIPKAGPGQASKVWLNTSDAIEGYCWEDTYTGGANPVIQGGAVLDTLMYLPCGYNTSANPSVIYVWDLKNRQMKHEIYLQGVFTGELEDVSTAIDGRLYIQAQPNHIYWAQLDSLPAIKAASKTWADVGIETVPEGYYYLKARSATDGKNYYVSPAALPSGTSSKGDEGTVVMMLGDNKAKAQVPDTADAKYIFHVIPRAAAGTGYVIKNCGLAGTPYVHQLRESNRWSVMNFTAFPQPNAWSVFNFSQGSSEGWTYVKPSGTGATIANMRIWRKGGAKNGVTTSLLNEYSDKLNDFGWEPITSPSLLAYAQYCETVNSALALAPGHNPGHVERGAYDTLQSYLSGLDLTYSPTANYATMLNALQARIASVTVQPTGRCLAHFTGSGYMAATASGQPVTLLPDSTLTTTRADAVWLIEPGTAHYVVTSESLGASQRLTVTDANADGSPVITTASGNQEISLAQYGRTVALAKAYTPATSHVSDYLIAALDDGTIASSRGNNPHDLLRLNLVARRSFGGNDCTTHYCKAPVALPAGITAYAVTACNRAQATLEVAPLGTDTVAACYGVLLLPSDAMKEATCYLPYLDDSIAQPATANLLKGGAQLKAEAAKTGTAIYSLQHNADGTTTFVKTSLDKLSDDQLANEAFLVLSGDDAQVSTYQLLLNQPTAVTTVAASRQVAHVAYYDLSGRRSTTPQPGVNLRVTTYTDGSQQVAKILR